VGLLAGALLWVSGSAAQGAGGAWDLAQLVTAALERNADLAAARAGYAASREGIIAARGERRSRVDVVGNAELFPRRERLLIFRHGFRKNGNPFETGDVDYGLELTMPLYTGGRIAHGISLAQARSEVARFRTDLSRNELVFDVASAYYTGLRLQQVIGAQQATLSALAESLRIGEVQRKVGRIARLDLLRIQTRVAQAERDLAGTRNGYARTLEILKQLTVYPVADTLTIKGELREAPAQADAAALRKRALARRPDLHALRQALRARREAAGVAKSSLLPSLNLKAGYRVVTGFNDGVTKDDPSLFLRFRMPIFDGGVLEARKRRALGEVTAAELRLRDGERRALGEVQRALLDLRTTGPRLLAARRAVAQGRETVRVERAKFAGGRGTSNDLLLAEEALLKTRTELALVLADNQIAAAALRLAVGDSPVPIGTKSTD